MKQVNGSLFKRYLFILIVSLFSISLPLHAQTDPTVASVPSGSVPSVPSGSKVTCLVDPNKLDPSPTCPVLEWNGYTYWALSYIDNRVAMNIVAYDADGNIAKQWEKSGSRYVYKISVANGARTASFFGQSNATIVMNWSDLYLAPKAGIDLNSSAVPKDQANGQTLAEFAWQEFVALNWPSLYDQTNPVAGTRGKPGTTGNFVSITGSAATQPLTVWQTYAHKTEILVNSGTLKPWSQLGEPHYNYTATTNIPSPALVNNLDENSQLGLCYVENNGSRLVYEAKVNQTEYEYYLNANSYYYNTGDASTNNLLTNNNRIKAVSLQGGGDMNPNPNLLKYGGTCNTNITGTASDSKVYPIICHPCGGTVYQGVPSEGAIEVKASWRELNSNDNPNRFYKQKVMVWKESGSTFTAEEKVLGLVGLHIIHKTTKWPSFTFATFEQIDNFNGLKLFNSAPGEPQYVVRNPSNSDTFVQDPNRPQPIVASASPTAADFLAQSPEVQAANNWVHANLPQSSVWQYYKLAGIQAEPTSTPSADPNYYLANNVTETNISLRDFRGPGNQGPAGSKGNGLDVTDNPLNFNIVNQVGGAGSMYNMGGCQGCHGIAQVRIGADFSFLTGSTEVAHPEPFGVEESLMLMLMDIRADQLESQESR